MSILPDEIWSRILEIGIETSRLSYRDMCCISITCRRLNRLSSDDALWSTLLSLDFPSPEHPLLRHNSPSKSLYKCRFERQRALKLSAYRRAVLNVESQIAVCSKNIEEQWLQLVKENEKMKATVAELTNLEKVRQASIALNVWQPEIIRDRQKQVVGQCAVPVEHRINALQMELRICKQQFEIFNKAYKALKSKLREGKERLSYLKYHPLHDYQSAAGIDDCSPKRRKLKQSDAQSHDMVQSCNKGHSMWLCCAVCASGAMDYAFTDMHANGAGLDCIRVSPKLI